MFFMGLNKAKDVCQLPLFVGQTGFFFVQLLFIVLKARKLEGEFLDLSFQVGIVFAHFQLYAAVGNLLLDTVNHVRDTIKLCL